MLYIVDLSHLRLKSFLWDQWPFCSYVFIIDINQKWLQMEEMHHGPMRCIPFGSGSSMEQPTVTCHSIFIAGVSQTQPHDWAVPEIVRSTLISVPRHFFDFVTCPRSQHWFTSRWSYSLLLLLLLPSFGCIGCFCYLPARGQRVFVCGHQQWIRHLPPRFQTTGWLWHTYIICI